MSQTLDELAAKKLVFGSLAQAVPVSQTDDQFASFVKGNLTTWAQTMQRARMTRFCTWLSSSEPCTSTTRPRMSPSPSRWTAAAISRVPPE
jgi:hypothetical protein